MPRITLHRISDPLEATRLAPLLSQAFGPRNHLAATLERWITDPTMAVVEARELETTAGLAVARWYDADEWTDGVNLEPETLGGFLGRRIATFQLLTVLPAFRRQGVGRLLCSALYEWMKSEGCQGAVGFAWQHGGEDSSIPLFRAAQFELLAELPGYYRTRSVETGHFCPVCKGPCDCAALLFGLLW